jgi:hypothetical protein
VSTIAAFRLLAGVSLIPALLRLTRLVRRARKMRARFVRTLPAIEHARWRNSRQWTIRETSW